LEDKSTKAANIEGHYFLQDLVTARRIFEKRPARHVDVGSRIDGFVAHIATFREIEVFDIRPLYTDAPNIKFKQADIMGEIPNELHNYCDSISCLHALEHFGLGRYGDRVEYDGHLLGIKNLHTILRRHGLLYLSVPIGSQHIEFNSHRVFSVEYLIDALKGKFITENFAYISDDGVYHAEVKMTDDLIKTNCGCKFGCGIFELKKI